MGDLQEVGESTSSSSRKSTKFQCKISKTKVETKYPFIHTQHITKYVGNLPLERRALGTFDVP